MRIQILEPALQDMERSYRFYERQQRGLGAYFRECIREDLVLLRSTAGIHSKVRGFHHVISEVFKSVIYYKKNESIAVVFAILDGRIDPKRRDRLLKRRQ
jgi:hypothetical protein